MTFFNIRIGETGVGHGLFHGLYRAVYEFGGEVIELLTGKIYIEVLGLAVDNRYEGQVDVCIGHARKFYLGFFGGLFKPLHGRSVL